MAGVRGVGDFDRRSVRGLRHPRRRDEPGLRGQRPPRRVRPHGGRAQDAQGRAPRPSGPAVAVRHRVPALGPARPASQHRPGPCRRDHRRQAVRGPRAGAGGRPDPLDRHAPARPGPGAAVRRPVLPGDGARAAAGAELPPRHQAGQPADHRGRDPQDHRLRAGADLRGDGRGPPRAARRLDPAGRGHRRSRSGSSSPTRGTRRSGRSACSAPSLAANPRSARCGTRRRGRRPAIEISGPAGRPLVPGHTPATVEKADVASTSRRWRPSIPA